ncbi:hypothetical protein HV419_16580 [Bacillus sporothermodurans]|uniref:hypothetical protein n=1 Tax=Heyndrickxia sporothermodurans TaxID=46224 RepID=UPI00192BA050|nr:hypothetical protein [Heyndrickxia sporothermodurans]MBL5801289.1 hypothetical protein [Heyndrickxia sporothermodurans]MBL5815833.1 hypothetical protein [Heyndrickxia sporothermodurans]MBL5844396.1 hypothetical protein [Heyndrickxia sporothermodurans]
MALGERHGLSGTKVYKVWKTIRLKCYGSNIDNRYKGEHLWICDEWREDPVAFVNWAAHNGYQEGLELARKDKDDGYYPENCIFVKKKETSKTHGMRWTRLYNIWSLMHSRCEDPNLDYYERYGGRGISVCDDWKQFEAFEDWAMNNGYEDGLSIDRIDVNGNYEPGNCKWSTNLEQSRNKRNSVYIPINGESRTIGEWAEISGLSYKTIQRRLRTGCKEEDLLAPIGEHWQHVEINGIIKPLSVWAKEAGLQYTTVQRRYKRGVRGEDLLKKRRLDKKAHIQLTFDLDS